LPRSFVYVVGIMGMREEGGVTVSDGSDERDASESDRFAELFKAVTGTTEVTESQEEERSHDPVDASNQTGIDLEDGLTDAVGTPESE